MSLEAVTAVLDQEDAVFATRWVHWRAADASRVFLGKPI